MIYVSASVRQIAIYRRTYTRSKKAKSCFSQIPFRVVNLSYESWTIRIWNTNYRESFGSRMNLEIKSTQWAPQFNTCHDMFPMNCFQRFVKKLQHTMKNPSINNWSRINNGLMNLGRSRNYYLYWKRGFWAYNSLSG